MTENELYASVSLDAGCRDEQRQPLGEISVCDALVSASYVLRLCLNCHFFNCWFQALSTDFCCCGHGFNSFLPSSIVVSPSSHYICNFRFCIFCICQYLLSLSIYICTHTHAYIYVMVYIHVCFQVCSNCSGRFFALGVLYSLSSQKRLLVPWSIPLLLLFSFHPWLLLLILLLYHGP